jgi:hypothetical protein
VEAAIEGSASVLALRMLLLLLCQKAAATSAIQMK